MGYIMVSLDSIPEITVAHYFSTEFYDSGIRRMPGIELMICEKGNWNMELSESSFIQKPGELVILPLHIPHRQFVRTTHEEKAAHQAVHFTFTGGCELLSEEEFIKQIAAMQSLGDSSTDLYRTKLFLPVHMELMGHEYINDILAKLIKDYHSKKIFSRFTASVILQNLLIEVSKLCIDKASVGSVHLNRALESNVSKVIKYISENYREITDASEIAKHVGLNTSYMGTIFKQQTGTSVIGYLNTIRVWRAKMLIEATDLSFKEITDMVGAGNYYHFSTIFKKQTGMTMSEYSKLAASWKG